MKILFNEIYRIFKKAPFPILLIWIMDMTESLLLVLNPYIIGRCIDGLLEKKFFWFFILIIVEVTFLVSYTLNKYLDTRVYSRIISEESISYYSKVILTNADNSLISARLDLIDEIPNFLEIDLLQILNIIGGICFSLMFLYFKSTILVFGLAVTISVLVPVVTYPLQINISQNNIVRKNIEEKTITYIASKDRKIYRQHLKDVMNLEICDSDLDSKIFFVTRLFQVILLIAAVLSIVSKGHFSSGELFSTITYVEMLNSNVAEINNNIILIKNLGDTVIRLKHDQFN